MIDRAHYCPCKKCGVGLMVVRSALTLNVMPLNAEPDPSGDVRVMDNLAYLADGTLWWDALPALTFRQHGDCQPKVPE